ncbi:SagB/ThcOx family dehydrogenase [Paludibacter sp. 221]|uniref:SagB/ThcOx family dehydrogenase n=1 Tax=Paludibacter sp. 221 TaxID=2302939 RepID=UPI0013D6F33D|nr:SagB/ThcOx family dehydrogenase [Paludibacter sp. 221]NDV47068.1 SagB/ThcOx family dehydrogenase [Paludibacter sp. 221]
MKKGLFLFVALSLVFAACQPSQKNEKTTHASDTCCSGKGNNSKPEPMELKTFKTIKLLAPDTECGASLMQAAQNRKSDRDFAETNLSLEHLSEILWMANGKNREDGKRTVPSALAMYPLETYAVLVNGIYHYDVDNHQLNPVVEGDFRNLAGLQDFVYTAPLNLVFVANYNKYNGARKVPENKRLYLAALDAGHCTQNVYLYCAAKGLKSVVRAGAKEKELLNVLGLDANYQFVVAQTVGY